MEQHQVHRHVLINCETVSEFIEQVEMNDFSSCCASLTFTTEMAVASPFSSLEHAIAVARDI
ncbi:hypothetical protein Ahy_B03g065790 [Arachis hypogaea]|uniref:Uncharacterized protein n=1 Tax=Arachis hypogaea TaxID=3818 RepID=A0A445A2C1_ARAHY|nr:hypothetical protein Ahy_B03g065790 [Arachis hypogaea]